jgi:hypothetical protein
MEGVPKIRTIVDYRGEGGQKFNILLDVFYAQPLMVLMVDF